MTMGGEAIIRKAQMQAAVVRDEIRDGYDRVLEGKIIWEKISLPGILYRMEVVDVEDRVQEELEVIQVRLGRVILGASISFRCECVLWELTGVKMGGEAIIRKAQVQAAVVLDEIRDG